MAKELPYFKFEPGAWENGNIQMCSKESKGLFIDLCSLYWSRLGELPYALALQKHCNGNADALHELIKHEIIGVNNDEIVIEFLDEQLSEFDQVSEKRRKAANKRWSDASALQMQSKSNAKRREETRRDETKKDKTTQDKNSADADTEILVWPTFDDFWSLYDKKVDRPRCEKKWAKIAARARTRIMDHLQAYVQATPDKQYRKNPLTYLNNEAWENEVITHNKTNGATGQFTGKTTKQQQSDALAEHLKQHYREKFGGNGFPGN